MISAVENGEILFAVDQQQYLQGWLPITFLHLYNRNLNTVGGGLPVNTGPGFVTKGERGRGGQAGGERDAMTATTVADERLAASGRLRRLLIRPELGAVVGAVLVFAFSPPSRRPSGRRTAWRTGWTRRPRWGSWRWRSPC